MKTTKPPRRNCTLCQRCKRFKKSSFLRTSLLSPFRSFLSLSPPLPLPPPPLPPSYVCQNESRARAVTHLFCQPEVFSASSIIKLASRCFSVCPSLLSHVTRGKKKYVGEVDERIPLYLCYVIVSRGFLLNSCDRVRVFKRRIAV